MMRKSGCAPPATPPAGVSLMRTTTPPAEVSSRARARDTLGSLRVVEVGAPFDELAHDRVLRVLDLLHRPNAAHPAVIQHGDPGSNPVRAPHVVRDHDT